MNKILFLLLFSIAFFDSVYGQTQKRVFILHSYSQEYPWTKSQHKSFVSKLEDTFSSSVTFSTEYLDTKRVDFNYEYEQLILNYLQNKYKEYQPDVIYVTDDDALIFFLHHHTELFPKVPVVFSGVNDLKLIGTLYPDKFTGVFETKEILPNIDLIQQFSPQTRDIWIVGDGSTTYKSIEADIREKTNYLTKYNFHYVSSENISDILDKLPDTHKSFVILTTIGKWRDGSGNNLSPKKSIDTLLNRRNLVLCSMEDAYMVGGVIGGFMTSGTEQGRNAAVLAGRYLKGEPFNQIRSITKSPNIYMFDRRAVLQSRIVLSEYVARNATILYPEKSFFDRYQPILLNTLFVLFVALLIFIVFSFFLFLEKNRQIEALNSDFDNLLLEKNRLNELFLIAEDNLNIGCWQWKINEDTITYSEGFRKIFGIDVNEEIDFENFMLSVYPAHKTLVQSMIKEVLDTHSDRTFHHKIVCKNGNILPLIHSITPFRNDEGATETLVGMVQKSDA